MSGILIVAEHRRGGLNPVNLELVSAAAELRVAQGGTVAVAVIAKDPQALAGALNVSGVDEVIAVESPADEFQPEVYEAAAKALIETRKPGLVLIPHSIDGWGYAPALGAAGYGFASDVFAIRYEGESLVAVRAAYKEKVHMELDFPGRETVVLTVRAGSFMAAEGAGSAEVSSFKLPAVTPRSQHRDWKEPEATGDVDITRAEFMLSIGRGIGEEANVEQFRELAEVLGAALGCSRPIADNGWLPKSRQVGQSGKTVAACKLYLAMGISGSVQHMAGMKHVETIIAVNTDPEAAIFSVAKYGIVADIFDIAEEMRVACN
ncbi:MAG: electron transfer flavoprotein subunit alpha/FixB family protein [Gammaproteobacteria bacterium]